MAYHESVALIEGDLAVVQITQASLEHSDSPRVFQFNNQEPHVIAKEYMGNAVGNVSTTSLEYSPNGRYLVWCVNQRVIIYDLDTGGIKDTSTGVTVNYPVFTGDSTTVLLSTTTAPFIIALDLYTGNTKGTINGTYTFTASNLRGSGYGAKCYLINAGSASTTASIYEYDSTTNSITTVATTGYNYGYIACSVSGKFMVAIHGAATATGPLSYIYNLDNLSEPPYTVGTSSWRGQSGNSAICSYGSSGQKFVMMLGVNNATPRFVEIFKGATLADCTMTAMSASGQGALSSITGIDGFGFIFAGYLNTFPPYNARSPVCYADLRSYAGTGSITTSILPGVNEKYATVAVSPRFTVRRLAGVVKTASGTGAGRKVVVINRRTMRIIAQVTSNSQNGTFTIPIYNGEQCIVMAIGTDSYSSKLVDYVAPVV
jgi:hypothetical protein